MTSLDSALAPVSAVWSPDSATGTAAPWESTPPPLSPTLLVVDDDPRVRALLRAAFHPLGFVIDEADNGVDAVTAVSARAYDLMLLDLDLPQLRGDEVLRQVRGRAVAPHMKVLVVSGSGDGDVLSHTLADGADDFLTKPFSVTQLRARASAALRLKQAQDRADRLTRTVAQANLEMERALGSRDGELVAARGALVLALAKLVEARSNETGGHLLRLQRYSAVLGAAAAATPRFATRLTPEVCQAIAQAAPLHDIGKVAVPDAILNKPGRLTAEEFEVMKGHAAAGADTLAEVCKQYQFASAFLHTAREVARSHHEKWSGAGYPDGLAGESIPLSARVVAVADVYDALRSPRVYKKAFTHHEAVDVILCESPGHFDPGLATVFATVHPQFERIYADTTG
jgi:putative two-component system response regulator